MEGLETMFNLVTDFVDVITFLTQFISIHFVRVIFSTK